MMNYVFLKKSKIIGIILVPLFTSAQYQIVAKKDLNLDNIQDVIYKDSVTNKLIFEYGNSIENRKNDSIFFFSNYNSEAGSLNVKVIKSLVSVKFTYAPKYLDFDLLNFSYDKLKKDWILTDILSSRTNPLSERLMTEKCQYKIPRKMSFFLTKNNFDNVQEKLLDNKKYLIKCSKNNLE
ncbi:hypothetical protein J2810_001427 [Chryseobacterium rhizosphaerae]|uniref:hypothetical protein n=1 Tax=Chryseobacterium rhizosphaerae TaxID=395937 RepID=UPI000645DB6B|nr:hypothetical protein [Chryseobacterium rhizosphaerae]MDR6545380.1 hypothetical protein [Chryseobacterium rhizosphaerae]